MIAVPSCFWPNVVTATAYRLTHSFWAFALPSALDLLATRLIADLPQSLGRPCSSPSRNRMDAHRFPARWWKAARQPSGKKFVHFSSSSSRPPKLPAPEKKPYGLCGHFALPPVASTRAVRACDGSTAFGNDKLDDISRLTVPCLLEATVLGEPNAWVW